MQKDYVKGAVYNKHFVKSHLLTLCYQYSTSKLHGFNSYPNLNTYRAGHSLNQL